MIEKTKKTNFILYIFIIALILRVTAVLVINYGLSPELRYKIISPDARGYDVAMDILRTWETGKFYHEQHGTFSNYQYLVAGIFYFCGFIPILPPLINAVLGALAVFFIYDLAKRLFNKRIAYISALLYTFFPSLIFWASQNLKDMICIFIAILAVWASVRLRESFRILHLVILILIVPLLFTLNELRNYIFVFVMYAIIFSFLFNISRLNFKRNTIYALYFYLIMCILPQYLELNILARMPSRIYAYMMGRGREAASVDISMLTISNKLLKKIRRHNRGGAIGGAAIRTDLEFLNLADAIKYLPTGMTYFLFAPFPWRAKGLLQIATIPEMLIWYILFPFVLYGMYIYRTKWKISFAIIFFVAITLVAYSLYEGNFGTGYRHKAILLPFFFIFAGAGIDYLWGRKGGTLK